jgi:hypothetical protein
MSVSLMLALATAIARPAACVFSAEAVTEASVVEAPLLVPVRSSQLVVAPPENSMQDHPM